MEYPHKNIRLNAAQYQGERWYFVTICCASRKRIFATPRNAEWVIGALRRVSSAQAMAVYAYCVMPHHLHILVRGKAPTSDLLRFVKEFKQRTTHECMREFSGRPWQKKFYDHILRPKDSPDAVAAYIWMNPVRKGLCRSAVDHAFSGSWVVDWDEIAEVTKPWVPIWKGGERTGSSEQGVSKDNKPKERKI